MSKCRNRVREIGSPIPTPNFSGEIIEIIEIIEIAYLPGSRFESITAL